jgi:integrase
MPKPERLASGHYKVRFRHGLNQAGTGLRETSETFPTKRAADEFAGWVNALGAQGALDRLYEAEQQAAVPTLDRIAADHIELLTGIEDGTRLSYTRLWARTWSPLLGHIPANRLTRDDVARAVNDLGTRYSHKSLENQRGLLSAVVQRAVEHGHLPKNHAKGIRLPRGQEGDRKEMRILTPAEFADVAARIPERHRPLVRFLAGTGCRWGEAVALQVGDVALPNVRIRRALKWSPDNHRTIGATKTRRSNRTIVIPPELHDDLRHACDGKARGDLVFTAPKGGAVLHRTFWSRVWLPAVSHLEPRPRIHDLRHSHASWLLAQGVPIHIVQMRLGHESIKTTVDTYGSLLPDAQALASDAASLAFTARAELG